MRSRVRCSIVSTINYRSTAILAVGRTGILPVKKDIAEYPNRTRSKIASLLPQNGDRLAQVTQRFHAQAVLPPNFFGDRDVTLVAVEKRFDHESAVSCPCADGIAVNELVPRSAGLGID